MFDAISPFDGSNHAASLPEPSGSAISTHAPEMAAPADGRLELAFARRDGATRLAGLYQKTPLRAFFPRHESGDLAVAALANVGGGLVGGDRADVHVRLGAGARAMVTSQAAEKVYRSTGADCRVTTHLEVGQDGWLEWCPQETILFDRSRLRRTLRLDLQSGARAMLGETLVLGRLASGERTSRGLLHDRIDVHVGPTLAWTDRLRLEGAYAGVLAATAGLGGAVALATFVYAAADAPAWSISPASWVPPRASTPGSPPSTASCSPVSWPPIRLRCGAHSRCSGPAFARPRPGCRPSCRGSGTSEGTPCI